MVIHITPIISPFSILLLKRECGGRVSYVGRLRNYPCFHPNDTLRCSIRLLFLSIRLLRKGHSTLFQQTPLFRARVRRQGARLSWGGSRTRVAVSYFLKNTPWASYIFHYFSPFFFFYFCFTFILFFGWLGWKRGLHPLFSFFLFMFVWVVWWHGDEQVVSELGELVELRWCLRIILGSLGPLRGWIGLKRMVPSQQPWFWSVCSGDGLVELKRE